MTHATLIMSDYVTIRELMGMFQLSKVGAHNLCRRYEIKTVKLHRQLTLVPRNELTKLAGYQKKGCGG